MAQSSLTTIVHVAGVPLDSEQRCIRCQRQLCAPPVFEPGVFVGEVFASPAEKAAVIVMHRDALGEDEQSCVPEVEGEEEGRLVA